LELIGSVFFGGFCFFVIKLINLNKSMETNKNGFAAIGIVLAIIAVLAAGGAGVWYFNQTAKPKPVPVAVQQSVPLKPVNQANSLPEQNQPATRVVSQTQEPAAPAASSEKIINQPDSKSQTANLIKMRELDPKEYQLTYNGKDQFAGDGPITVKEILNCTVPDLSIKCPETSFIGEENCKNITHAPAECAYDGQLIKGSTPSCIYEDFGGVAMGTIVTGYYGLVIRNGECFLISWSLMHYNCDNYMPSHGESAIPYQNCIAGDSQRKMNNEQMISTFKLTGQATGWKTYQDAGSGFEFKYPSEATLTKSNVPYLNLYLEKIPVASSSNELQFRALMVSVQNDCSSYAGAPENYTDNTDYTVNDIKFTEHKENEGGNQSRGYYYNYFTVKNNKCFILSFALSGSKTSDVPKEEPHIFRQIVSTFKFTD
jgi:hypothetical protein